MEKNRVFGGICTHLLADYSHESSCWKTSQRSLFGEDETFSDRLPNWGIIVNGELYGAQVPSELPTEERVGFVLPTPTTDQRSQRYKQGGRSTLCAILEGDMMLPTPSANEHKYRLQGDTQASKCLEAMARQGTFGEKAKLHPHFVEWMMGFPIGWTELEP